LRVADSEPVAATTAAQIVAGNLRVDALTAEVLGALAEADVEYRLLKGASVARWLYEADEPRSYGDCDLLIAPPDLEGAREVLVRLGFVPEIDEAQMPGWWREHAVEWIRAGDSVAVDLHRTLPGMGGSPEQVWAALSAEPDTLLIAGIEAKTLPRAGLALQVALHAAQHGLEWGGPIASDLDRALARAGEETWRAAAALADRVGATAAFATGLRLDDTGARLADRLGLPSSPPPDVALRMQGAPPVSLGFEQLARAGGPAARLQLLARKVVPPATFIRKWFPPAANSRRALVLGYLWRPLWLLGHAPAGLRAWLRARRGA
jgi:hypothetical protein